MADETDRCSLQKEGADIIGDITTFLTSPKDTNVEHTDVLEAMLTFVRTIMDMYKKEDMAEVKDQLSQMEQTSEEVWGKLQDRQSRQTLMGDSMSLPSRATFNAIFPYAKSLSMHIVGCIDENMKHVGELVEFIHHILERLSKVQKTAEGHPSKMQKTAEGRPSQTPDIREIEIALFTQLTKDDIHKRCATLKPKEEDGGSLLAAPAPAPAPAPVVPQPACPRPTFKSRSLSVAIDAKGNDM